MNEALAGVRTAVGELLGLRLGAEVFTPEGDLLGVVTFTGLEGDLEGDEAMTGLALVGWLVATTGGDDGTFEVTEAGTFVEVAGGTTGVTSEVGSEVGFIVTVVGISAIGVVTITGVVGSSMEGGMIAPLLGGMIAPLLGVVELQTALV